MGLACVLFLPHLIWQFRLDFVYPDFFAYIHAHDIRWERTAIFSPEQLYANAYILTLPLWLAELGYVTFAKKMRPYRVLAWMHLLPLALFGASQGRGYYMAPGYPMLLAAGCAAIEHGATHVSLHWARALRSAVVLSLALDLVLEGLSMLPMVPVNSPILNLSRRFNETYAEQIGWRQLAQRVAAIDRSLTESERAHSAIFANNYGETCALDLYGPGLGLRSVISRTNAAWYHGYGNPRPSVVIELGHTAKDQRGAVACCTSYGRIRNRQSVGNEESASGYEIGGFKYQVQH